MKLAVFCHGILFLILMSVDQVFAQQTHWVLNSGDSGPGTLREAVQTAQAGDIIRIMPNVPVIQLTSDEILIDKPLRILGNEEKTTVRRSLTSSTPDFRIFRIEFDTSLYPNDSVYLNQLDIRDGKSFDGVEGATKGEDGGGILSFNIMVIVNCAFHNNQSGKGADLYAHIHNNLIGGNGGHGGAIYSSAPLIILNSEFYSNGAGRGGKADLHPEEGYYPTAYGGNGGSGGAIYCSESLVLSTVVLNENHAGDGGKGQGETDAAAVGGDGGSGGAVWCMNSLVEINGCTFSQNSSGNGGIADSEHVECEGDAGKGGAVCIENCQVEIVESHFGNNFSGYGNNGGGDACVKGGNGGPGGAMYCRSCYFYSYHSDFIGNNTGNGGNGYSVYYSTSGQGGAGGALYLENCTGETVNTFFGFNSTGNGGDLFLGLNISPAGNGGNGGAGVINGSSAIDFRRCIFLQNSTGNGGNQTINSDTAGSGGNAGRGGALFIMDTSSVEMMNCLFSGNLTGIGGIHLGNNSNPGQNGKGGAVYADSLCGLKIVNSTIAGNRTGYTDSSYNYTPIIGPGGGVFSGDSIPHLINTIIAYNETLLNDSIVPNDLSGIYLLDYCLVHDTSDFTSSGFANIFLRDPRFANFPDSLQPAPGSPAINNGSPDTSGLFLPEYDLDLNPRVNQRIDIGAYEYPGFLTDSLLILEGTLYFNDILIGLTGLDTLHLINTGTSTLLIDSLLLPDPYFILSPMWGWVPRLDSIVIYPGDSVSFPVEFQPEEPGTFLDSMQIWLSSESYSLTVLLSSSSILPIPPLITQTCPGTLIEGQYYSCAIAVQTFNGFPFHVEVLSKPDWIEVGDPVNDSILIYGSSAGVDPGPYSVELNISDDVSMSSILMDFSVIAASPPVINHNCNASVLAGNQYQCSVYAVDQNSLPVMMDIINYPSWLSWEKISDALISLNGIPGAGDAGTSDVTFHVADSLIEDTAGFTITVGVDGIFQLNSSDFRLTCQDGILSFNNDQKFNKLTVYNLDGRIVFRSDLDPSANNCSIRLPDLNSSLYLFEFKNDEEQVIRKVFYR